MCAHARACTRLFSGLSCGARRPASQGGTLLAIPLSFSIHEDLDVPVEEWVIDKVEYCYQM